ncbi:MAG: peptidylprolyl isomerase [Verrucomicrobiota bacterium]
MKSLFLPLVLLSLLAQLPAQELSPAVPVPPAAGAASADPLPNIESIANEAQRKLFEAADRASGGNPLPTENQPMSFPSGGPQVTTTGSGKKATFAAPKGLDPSTWPKDSDHKVAIMEIKFGGRKETVMFEMYPQDAPQTVSNFLDNVETGTYNGLAFHRAVEGFIVQTGDPLTKDEGTRDRWGTGGEAKSVPAEIKRKHTKGSVAMGRKADRVNSSKRSNGYQFYFALGHYGSLDGNYTVFGQVISGLDVLERIGKMPVDSNDCPIARIEIESVKVVDHKGPMYVSQTAKSDDTYVRPAAGQSAAGRLFRRIW